MPTVDKLATLIHEFAQSLLSLRQFTTTDEFGTVERDHTVDYDKSILSRHEHTADTFNQVV
jgi:hypothetical protein